MGMTQVFIKSLRARASALRNLVSRFAKVGLGILEFWREIISPKRIDGLFRLEP
jgi:hypothetical protein